MIGFRSVVVGGLRIVLALAAAAAMVAPAVAGSSEGKASYQRYCTQCHEQAQGDWRSRASRDFSNYVLRTPGRELKRRIETGGRLCPSYQGLLSAVEIDDLIDYIKELR
ncbi:MAG: cytochrome c [Motiliproteus sp.]